MPIVKLAKEILPVWVCRNVNHFVRLHPLTVLVVEVEHILEDLEQDEKSLRASHFGDN